MNSMSLFKFFSISAMVIGLSSGWASLDDLGSGQDAVTTAQVLFAFSGCLLGAALIVVFQAAFSGEDFAKRVVSFSLVAACYFVGSGLSALVASMFSIAHSPHALLVLVIGMAVAIGALLGRGILKIFYVR